MPSASPAVKPNNAETPVSPILLQSLQLSNLLSFGIDTPELSFSSLNILVGANGSGKSNLIDAIALLRSTPGDMAKVIRDGGGVQEWICKRNPKENTWIETIMSGTNENKPLRHTISFRADSSRFALFEEQISDVAHEREGDDGTIFHINKELPSFFDDDLKDGSALRVLRDPVNRPQLAYLADQYERIRIYREWQFGRGSLLRKPQAADMRMSFLEEDFSNLGLFLNRLCRDPKTKKTIVSYLRDLYDGVEDIGFDIVGGTVQIYFIEGEHTIPATRLSDGTLHYLCLLAILCDPSPPPLICIEEPELGLHPDILHKIADLLVDTSTRTQLIVTTHSEIIVDSMTETPDAVLVCEKREGQTHIERLDPVHLQIWLDKYRLGELWTSGELGGKRW